MTPLDRPCAYSTRQDSLLPDAAKRKSPPLPRGWVATSNPAAILRGWLGGSVESSGLHRTPVFESLPRHQDWSRWNQESFVEDQPNPASAIHRGRASPYLGRPKLSPHRVRLLLLHVMPHRIVEWCSRTLGMLSSYGAAALLDFRRSELGRRGGIRHSSSIR
jgi:hypothetical protein